MSSLSSILPIPKQSYNNEDEHPLFQQQPQISQQQQQQQQQLNKPVKIIPPYRKRKGYQPKEPEDFGDGGAFPEIHIVQFPLGMGKKKSTITTTTSNSNINSSNKSIVPISVDESGRVKHEAVIGNGKIVQSQYTDLIPKEFGENDLQRPNEEEINETIERTKAALEKKVNLKIKAAQPTSYADKQAPVSFVKYTPQNQNGQTNSGASSRIVKMVEVAQDPMEPPKFKIKKKVKGPPSPPAPVMHSPPRKLTVQEQEDWKIPPCISNWKNPKGFAIALDKRLAADGHNLQKVEINDKFAHLSQSLYIAESNAREEVSARAELERLLIKKEKEKQQEMLRKLAEDVRNERSGINDNDDDDNDGYNSSNSSRKSSHRNEERREYKRNNSDDEDDYKRRASSSSTSKQISDSESSDSSVSSDDSEDEERREKLERDRIRNEKKRERERQFRMEASGKKSKLNRDQDRDVSEKIALGQAVSGRTDDSIYDQRLFNQSEGFSSGLGDDDSYNVYSKPLFGGSVSNSIYRPKNNQEDVTTVEDVLASSRFKHKGIGSGNDSGKDQKERNGPVQFERERTDNNNKKSSDPFGMDEFLSSAKKKK
eukprot:gene7899-9718_t